MLDFIKLKSNVKILEKNINKKKFKYTKEYNDDEEQEEEYHKTPCYFYRKNNVIFIYSPARETLYISGKLINFSFLKNTIYTTGDLYIGYYERDTLPYHREKLGKFTDLETSINDFNKLLFKLTKTKLNIRNFIATRIDVCFNLLTFFRYKGYKGFKLEFEQLNYSEKYIELFNLIYKQNLKKSYINYVLHMNEPLNGSFYIKPRQDFLKKSKQCRTINFYCKGIQLQNFKNESTKESRKTKITDEGIEKARNILRLEVQMGNEALRDLKLDNKPLKHFINLQWCREQVIKDYKKFISQNEYLDFYSYGGAKNKILNSGLNNAEKIMVLEYLLKFSRGHKNIPNEKTCIDILHELGIHEYLIPPKWEIEQLPSPVRELDKLMNIIQEGFSKNRLLLETVK